VIRSRRHSRKGEKPRPKEKEVSGAKLSLWGTDFLLGTLATLEGNWFSNGSPKRRRELFGTLHFNSGKIPGKKKQHKKKKRNPTGGEEVGVGREKGR